MQTLPAPDNARLNLQGSFFQGARVVDVFVLGPFMVWYAWRSPTMPDWARLLLAVGGLMTVGFNLRNYLLVDRTPTRDRIG